MIQIKIFLIIIIISNPLRRYCFLIIKLEIPKRISEIPYIDIFLIIKLKKIMKKNSFTKKIIFRV